MGGAARAYPVSVLAKQKAVNDVLGGKKIVIVADKGTIIVAATERPEDKGDVFYQAGGGYLQRRDAGRSIGHVHLKVSDLARSEAFYRDVLGFKPRMRFGDKISFLAFDDEYHHHLALNVSQTQGAPPSPSHAPGILHFAILFKTRQALIEAAKQVMSRGVEIFGASDHGTVWGSTCTIPTA